MKPAERANRPREYPAHPVPRQAAHYPHVGMFFAAEGERFLGDANGTTLAQELARPLLPTARLAVLGS